MNVSKSLFASVVLLMSLASCSGNHVGQKVYIENLYFKRIHIKRDCKNIMKLSRVTYVDVAKLRKNPDYFYCNICVSDKDVDVLRKIMKENEIKLAKNSFYTITTKDGKSIEISKYDIKKRGWGAFAENHEGATVLMLDDDKNEYDVPLEHYEDAIGQGLHLHIKNRN